MMPNIYLIDTDTFSYITDHRSVSARARFLEIPKARRCISTITYAEIQYGLQWAPHKHNIRTSVELYLAMVTILPWPVEAAPHYARERIRLMREGRTIGVMDIMIAAHATAIDATLVTNNTRHFNRIEPPLRIENWTS